MNFKTFYYTETVSKSSIPSNVLSIIDSIFDSSELKTSTSKTDTYILRSKSRASDQEAFKKALSKAKISYTEESKSSSIPAIIIDSNNKQLVFLFKDTAGKGGMQETTINSTITELVPAILFKYPKLLSSKFMDTLDNILNNWDSIEVFVNESDKEAGKKLLLSAKNSSKFSIKMKAAMSILSYLKSVNSSKGIKQIWWAYRAKPAGVAKNSSADIVLKLKDNSLLGISLKAGTESTNEPQLNTSVNQIKEFFESSMKDLSDQLYNKFYKTIPGITKEDFDAKNKNYTEVLSKHSKDANEDYEDRYNKVLKYIKDSVASDFSNVKKMKEFISKKILKNDSNDIPVITIKAIGDTFKEVSSNTHLDAVLPFVKNIKVVNSDTNKQILFVTLDKPGANDPVMIFSIRSTKSSPGNKLHQAPNLKVIYAGLKQTKGE